MMIETDEEKTITIRTITVQAILIYSFTDRLKKMFTLIKVFPKFYEIRAMNKDKNFWNFSSNEFGPFNNHCTKVIKALDFGDWLILFWKLEEVTDDDSKNFVS